MSIICPSVGQSDCLTGREGGPVMLVPRNVSIDTKEETRREGIRTHVPAESNAGFHIVAGLWPLGVVKIMVRTSLGFTSRKVLTVVR